MAIRPYGFFGGFLGANCPTRCSHEQQEIWRGQEWFGEWEAGGCLCWCQVIGKLHTTTGINDFGLNWRSGVADGVGATKRG